MQSLTSMLSGTPAWVWGIFIFCVIRVILSRKKSTKSKKDCMFSIGLGCVGLWFFNVTAINIVALIVGLVVGFLKAKSPQYYLQSGKIAFRKKESVIPGLILIVFALKYIDGYLIATGEMDKIINFSASGLLSVLVGLLFALNAAHIIWMTKKNRLRSLDIVK